MSTRKSPAAPKRITDLTHPEATRKNIPTVEHQSVMSRDEQAPKKLRYPRNPDLDPQLVWRGKDEQDSADLVVNAPPLYIQEKVKPKALIDDLRRQSASNAPPQPDTLDLFGDFNGLPEGAERTEFYQHDGHWQNRMILGDSLQVMASLAEREGLRGKVQCIYFDPPYGIKFNSNLWQNRAHYPRTRTGQGISGYLERRHPLVSDLFARPADGGAGFIDRIRVDFCADWR